MAKLSEADLALMYAETLEDVQKALANGANVNARDEENGWSALMVATRLDIVKALVEAGACIDTKVCEEQKDGEIKKYLDACVALLEADTIEKAEKALADGAYIDARDGSGNTALILTGRRTGTGEGAKEAVEKHLEFLLKKGANVNAQNNFGSTAIMSVTTKNKAIILLKNKADINIKNAKKTTGKDCLFTKFKMSATEISEVLKEITEQKPAPKAHTEPDQRKVHFEGLGKWTNPKEFWAFRISILKKIAEAQDEETIYKILNSDDVKRDGRPVTIDKITDARNRNALIYIASFEYGHEWPVSLRKEKIKLLVKCGTDINAKDEKGDTALTHALRLGDNKLSNEEKKEFIAFLIELGADVSHHSIWKAAKINGLEKFLKEATRKQQTKQLIKSLSTNSNFVGFPKDSTLDWTIVDEDGRTAIMLAAKNKNIEQLNDLYINGGFSVISAKDRFGKTVWDYAEDNAVRQYLHEIVDRVNLELVCADTLQKAKDALKHGADINAVNIRRQNALILALEKGKNDIAEYLINEGIDVNARDSFGATPLMYVQTKKQAEMLINAGANVNAKDNSGNTVFQYIKYSPNYEELKEYFDMHQDYLNKQLIMAETTDELKDAINAGADVNAKYDEGRTALMYAHTAEQTKILLDAGADVNARDNDGRSVLMYAKNVEQIKLLIDAEADLFARDNAGKTVFDYFKEREDLTTFLNDERLKRDPEVQSFIHRQEIRNKIEQYKKTHRILKYKEHVLSGVVVADRIAENIISHKETREITPAIGKQIRENMTKEYISQRMGSNR